MSSEKTEVDVTVACKIAREFAVSFSVFVAEFGEDIGSGNYRKWLTEDDVYTMEELLKIYEDEI